MRAAERAAFIGSSDAAAIAGVDPYKTTLALYYEKRGEISPEPAGEAAHFGIVLEDVVAREYARRTGRRIRRVGQRRRHREYPWIVAQVDRDVVSTERQLECKTGSAFLRERWGPDGSDDVPEHYLLQCQHALGVTGKRVTDLAVLIGGQDFRIYEIGRDDSIITLLTDLEIQFWRRVQAGDPPPMDDARPGDNLDLMRRLYRGTNGEIVALPPEAMHWHAVVQDARHRAKEYEAITKGGLAHLAEIMGMAAIALLPDGSGGGYTRRVVQRKGYEVGPTTYVDIRFSEKPKGAKPHERKTD